MSNNVGYNVKDDDYSDCGDDTIDGQEENTEDMGVTGGSIGREKEDPIRRQRRLDSICGMSAVPVVNKVIGAKRKTIVGVDGRDREITEEESKSPWFTNKNPTRYGNAKDVARALVINQSKKEGAEEAREKRTEEDR